MRPTTRRTLESSMRHRPPVTRDLRQRQLPTVTSHAVPTGECQSDPPSLLQALRCSRPRGQPIHQASPLDLLLHVRQTTAIPISRTALVCPSVAQAGPFSILRRGRVGGVRPPRVVNSSLPAPRPMTSQGTAHARFTRAIERRNSSRPSSPSAKWVRRRCSSRSTTSNSWPELKPERFQAAAVGSSLKPGRSPSLSRSTRTPRSVLSERGSVKWSTCRTLVSAREVLEARARGQLKRNARIELCRLSAGHASRRTFGAGSTVTLARRFG